jgi:hypothetical protein
MNYETKDSARLAPIAIFGYNRIDYLKRTLTHLLKCNLIEKTEVFFL